MTEVKIVPKSKSRVVLITCDTQLQTWTHFIEILATHFKTVDDFWSSYISGAVYLKISVSILDWDTHRWKNLWNTGTLFPEIIYDWQKLSGWCMHNRQKLLFNMDFRHFVALNVMYILCELKNNFCKYGGYIRGWWKYWHWWLNWSKSKIHIK